MLQTRKLEDTQGFTLIELMIVIAIIGVIASIALPVLSRLQLRSRAAEGKVNLAAIQTAEEAYLAEFSRYVAIASTPQARGVIGFAGLGNEKAPWLPCPNPVGADAPGHCILGWQPDGPTYYNYAVSLSPPGNSFSAAAESDIDADGNINYWGIEKPDLRGVVTAPAANPGCPIGAVRNMTANPPAAGAVNLVGPCGLGFGLNIF